MNQNDADSDLMQDTDLLHQSTSLINVSEYFAARFDDKILALVTR